MDIKTFANLLRRHNLWLFTVREAEVLLPAQNTALMLLQLHQWCRKGWIKRVKRGLYEPAYPEQIVLPDLYVANKLYEPSYVSLETALSHYQLLPETAAQVTSVTPNATRRFKNFHGLFTYFSVRPRAFAGYALIRLQGRTVRIAEPEKAVVDRLYMSLRRGEDRRSVCDRWDLGRIKKMDKKKLASYADLFETSAGKIKELIHALLRWHY